MFYEKTQKLADEAFSRLTELDSVAKTFATTVKTINGFTRQGGGEFGTNAQVIAAAFSDPVLEKNENSPLITIGEDTALVLRVAAHHTPTQRPLDEVRADIIAKLTEQAAKAAADKQVTDTLAQLQSGAMPWSGLNKSLPSAPVGKKMLARRAADVSPQVLQAAFAIPKADVSADKPAYRRVPLPSGDEALLMVTAVQSGTVADATAMTQLKQQQMQREGGTEFNQYLGELERAAKIKRNPKAFE
jgi:peptidyl-prolyl cis-trans isomerase D